MTHDPQHPVPLPRHAPGFATLPHEVALARLPVQGTLPPWLAGTLLRNGPAQFEVGAQAFRHWFDGLAMLHKFSFAAGAVSYANRYLRTRAYLGAQRTGQIDYTEFATDPCRGLFGRALAMFTQQPVGIFTDNANIAIGRLAGEAVAFGERPLPIRFDAATLETLGVLHYDDHIRGQLTTAHPHYDPRQRAHISYVTQFAGTYLTPRHRYHITAQPAASARRRVLASVPTDVPAYMHSFAITPRYVVLTENPFVVPLDVGGMLLGRPFVQSLRWQPERGTRFTVIEQESGAVVGRWHADAFAAFHHANAFEQAGEIVLDLCAYPDASLYTSQFYLDSLRQVGARIQQGELRRYRLRPGQSHARQEALSDAPLELPRIHYERANGQPYRYVYGAGFRPDAPPAFFNQLVKVDVTTGAARTWFENGCFPGEPVFVPAPAAAPESAQEDAGVVLSVVLDAVQGRSFLLVLDGASFGEVARATVPHAIPFGFHGDYFGE